MCPLSVEFSREATCKCQTVDLAQKEYTMKKHLLFAVFVLILTVRGQAQVDPLYAQYLNNPLLINPAYAGLNNNFNAGVSYRKQWAGFEGSPTTYNLNAHTSLLDNRMGLGLIVLKDNVGINSNTEVHGTYAYRLGLVTF